MATHQELFKSLITMVDWTIQQQSKCIELKSGISILSWSKEYATIKFCVSRQSGHSNFAYRLLTEYFSNAVYISHNFSMLVDFRKKYNLCNLLKKRTVEISKLTDLRGLGVFDSVIIDTASLFSKTDEKKIYSYFVKDVMYSPKFCFIFLE